MQIIESIIERAVYEEEECRDNISERFQCCDAVYKMDDAIDKMNDAICCIEDAVSYLSEAKG